MSNAKNNGNGCAYPAHPDLRINDRPVFGGLTKREYFAGLAMQGLVVNSNLHDYACTVPLAVKWAVALLEALEANNEQA
jgi:hypothetical protein